MGEDEENEMEFEKSTNTFVDKLLSRKSNSYDDDITTKSDRNNNTLDESNAFKRHSSCGNLFGLFSAKNAHDIKDECDSQGDYEHIMQLLDSRSTDEIMSTIDANDNDKMKRRSSWDNVLHPFRNKDAT